MSAESAGDLKASAALRALFHAGSIAYVGGFADRRAAVNRVIGVHLAHAAILARILGEFDEDMFAALAVKCFALAETEQARQLVEGGHA